MTATARRSRISRADIESKLREIKGEVDDTATAAKPVGLAAAVGAVIVVVGVAYFLGRRRGKKQTTLVEIRRV